MSLFFRSRTPRNSRRKSAPKALRKAPVPTLAPVFGAVSAPALAPVRHSPRRSRQRAIGYATHRPRQPMFRVT